MKIRNRLSIQFTVLVASILLVLCSLIYYVSRSQLRADFFEQLHDRTVTTAYIYLEEDGFRPHIYETVRERYVRTLPREIGQLFDMENRAAFVEPADEVPYGEEIIDHIRSHHTYPDYYAFSNGSWQSTGLFYPDNQGDFVVIVSAVDEIGRLHLTNLAWTLITGYLISILVLFLTGRFFASQALDPIPKILKQVNSISASNLHTRLVEGMEEDEISELVSTFNRFLDRLEDNFNMQKRFVANASHELRTPLTSIIGEIEVALSKARPPDEYSRVLTSVYHDTLTLHDLVSGLLEIAQAESEKLNHSFEPVRIDEVVIEAGLMIEKKYPQSKVHVNYLTENGRDADFLLSAYNPLLLNVFVNVIDNAVKFSPDDHSADVTLKADEKGIEVQVLDSGIGIEECDLGRIFDPFYRSKDVLSYKGFGIGLSLVKRILVLLNGSITVTSRPGNGTLAVISFKRENQP